MKMVVRAIVEIVAEIDVYPDDVVNSDTIGDYKAELDCDMGNAACAYLARNLPNAEDIVINMAEPEYHEGIDDYSKLLNRYISNREKVEYCINEDSRLETAWCILQEIYKFRDKHTTEQASDELIKIIEKLEQTKIPEMISITKT